MANSIPNKLVATRPHQTTKPTTNTTNRQTNTNDIRQKILHNIQPNTNNNPIHTNNNIHYTRKHKQVKTPHRKNNLIINPSPQKEKATHNKNIETQTTHHKYQNHT